MTSEGKVKRLWPEARVKRWSWRSVVRYRVIVKPGRICYGETVEEAWTNAWDSIVQDDELCHGAEPQGNDIQEGRG